MSTDITLLDTAVEIPRSIEQIDLSWVRRGLRPPWVDDLPRAGWLLEYRRFLTLKLVDPDPSRIVPPAGVDDIWHEHILRTRTYREDCDRIFGRYLDHNPEFGVDNDGRPTKVLLAAWEYTKSAYRAAFGVEPQPAWWNAPVQCG